jgi:hypothetical protein
MKTKKDLILELKESNKRNAELLASLVEAGILLSLIDDPRLKAIKKLRKKDKKIDNIKWKKYSELKTNK